MSTIAVLQSRRSWHVNSHSLLDDTIFTAEIPHALYVKGARQSELESDVFRNKV